MKAQLLAAAALCAVSAVFAAPPDDGPADAKAAQAKAAEPKLDEPRPTDAKPGEAAKPEPAVLRKVAEDDNVRIEELSYRGQTQSIIVKSKIRGVSPYQIVPPSGARDPSQSGDSSGQSVWHFFSF